VFIAADRTLDVPYRAARARLGELADGGGLSRVSRDAYDHGFRGLVRVGPLGAVPGASKLVEVRYLEPVDRDGVTTVGLRWEATGPAAGLFPVLDASITLAAGGGDRTLLGFAGAYRAPLGRLGAGLDRAVLHRVADATIGALLTGVAAALTKPAADAAPGPAADAARQAAEDAADPDP
jgi:hypothetical protein